MARNSGQISSHWHEWSSQCSWDKNHHHKGFWCFWLKGKQRWDNFCWKCIVGSMCRTFLAWGLSLSITPLFGEPLSDDPFAVNFTRYWSSSLQERRQWALVIFRMACGVRSWSYCRRLFQNFAITSKSFSLFLFFRWPTAFSVVFVGQKLEMCSSSHDMAWSHIQVPICYCPLAC